MNNNQQSKYRVALLGATGYIGRSLLATVPSNFLITPFSRNVEKGKANLISHGIEVKNMRGYNDFLEEEFNLIINATGIGSPKKLTSDPQAVFLVTEEMDNLVFKYLVKYPDTRVFNLSSAAVYSAIDGRGDVSDYAKVKLASEKRHREHPEYAIVDLRVFAFISRWLDVNETFFIAEIAKCLRDKKVFHTNSADMMRDYCTADDLWEVIRFLNERSIVNNVYDMRSAKPVSKFEILDSLNEKFGLNYEISNNFQTSSPTGVKNNYYSKSKDLIELGFISKATALQNIEDEFEMFLRD